MKQKSSDKWAVVLLWVFLALTMYFFFHMVVGCGYFKKQMAKTGEPAAVVQLSETFSARLKELEEKSDDETGWPSTEDCDGTLWAGLARAAGADVNLDVAEYEPGQIHRRPTPCWTAAEGDIGAKSTISQDMLTGYLWGRWREENLGAFQRLALYGELHEERIGKILLGWIMGEPYPEMASRVLFRENGIGLVGKAIYALSKGDDERGYRHSTPLYPPVKEDYERHLQCLGILLHGELAVGHTLEVTHFMLDRLKSLSEHDPQDALFKSAVAVYTGDYAEAIALLLNQNYEYPSYVRGHENYKLVHWLFAAKLVLRHHR